MGSVRTLPEPADKIVLVRTPPDYATAQVYTLFFVTPCLCCLPIWTLCREQKGGPLAHCMLMTSLLMAIPILAIVVHGYYSMTMFYLDFSFSVSVDFSFVVVGMIAKAFLWAVFLIDTITCVVESVQKCCWGKDKIQQKVDQLGKASDRQWPPHHCWRHCLQLAMNRLQSNSCLQDLASCGTLSLRVLLFCCTSSPSFALHLMLIWLRTHRSLHSLFNDLTLDGWILVAVGNAISLRCSCRIYSDSTRLPNSNLQ